MPLLSRCCDCNKWMLFARFKWCKICDDMQYRQAQEQFNREAVASYYRMRARAATQARIARRHLINLNKPPDDIDDSSTGR